MEKNKVIKLITTLLILMISSSLFASPGPTVTLQTAALNNPFPLPFQVNVTFSDPVAGFFPADVTVTNGTVVSITGNSCQPNYVITIQPTATGNITILIPTNSAVSVTTGQPNQASNLLTIPADVVTGPSVTLQTSILSNPYPSTFSVNVGFSEPVIGISMSNVNVTNGTVVSITGNGCQSNYVMLIQPNSAGAVDALIPANSVVSLSTGTPNQASNLLSISGLNPNLRPSSNFNLESWSLNLPLPLGSKSNPLSIGQPTLSGTPGLNNGYTNQPYFFTDPVTGAMNFFAPLNGGTSSVNGYPSCELNEVLPGPSAYWKLSTFASNSLTALLLVNQITPSTKRIVIAEIHDKGNTDRYGHSASNSPFVKLYYDMNAVDPNNNLCNGCVYAQIRTTPAKSSYLKIVNLIQGIPLNTIFMYKLTLLNNGTLTINANDASTTIKVSTSDNNTIGWAAQDLYFEAGVINLENGTSNFLGGAASFYSLQVNHIHL